MAAAHLALSAMLLAGVDQAVKALVLRRCREGEAWTAIGGLAIRRCLNRRPARGWLGSRRALTALLGLETAAIAALVEFGPLFPSPPAHVALGVALGGASGNLIDRLWRDGVVDYIDLGFWPVFNLADVAIVAGVVVGIWWM